MNVHVRRAAAAAVVSFLILAGCSDNDDPAAPESGIGTVVVEVTPDVIGASWTLTGPGGFSESDAGDRTIGELVTGGYTIAWADVTGWMKPPGDTQKLKAGGTVTFSGTYVENNGPSGDFALIPADTFLMGSPADEPLREGDETRHSVILTRSFYMSTTEVTNRRYAELAQWAYDNGHCAATGASLSDALDGSTEELLDLDAAGCEISFSGGVFTVDGGREDHPALEVTWYGAAAYCDWLSLRDGLPRAYDHDTWQCNGSDPYGAQGYRLPTEAEWEHACRAGSVTPFNTGDCLDAGTEANYDGSGPFAGCPSGPSVGWTAPVGGYLANAYGLHDMHGNLWEWCNDREGSYEGDVTDPAGPYSGANRVLRGGYWDSYARSCRSANRNYLDPGHSLDEVGFRPVRSAD